MKKQALMMAVCVGLAASPLLAHGGAHLKGTVLAIGADEIKVKDADGHESQAKITPTTKFVSGKGPGNKDEIAQGDRVVVHTRKKGDALEAVEVHYGAPRKKGPP
ncbi:MAG TPA: hypothetical protein VN874_06130 [Myxococcales bacterium]|jgi:translation initiation factor IF-1|nr:hypothetical protein [Myxococcales bacterium]